MRVTSTKVRADLENESYSIKVLDYLNPVNDTDPAELQNVWAGDILEDAVDKYNDYVEKFGGPERIVQLLDDHATVDNDILLQWSSEDGYTISYSDKTNSFFPTE